MNEDFISKEHEIFMMELWSYQADYKLRVIKDISELVMKLDELDRGKIDHLRIMSAFQDVNKLAEEAIEDLRPNLDCNIREYRLKKED